MGEPDVEHHKIGRLSIRMRLTLVATAVSLVTLAFAGVVLYRAITASLDDALTNELRVHATDARTQIERGGVPSLSSGIETQILDASGSVLRPAGEGPLLDPDQTATASQQELIVDQDTPMGNQRILALPVREPGGPHVIAVAASTASIERTQQRLLIGLGTAGVFIAAASTAAAWLLSGAALRPVRTMSRTAESLSTSDASARLPLPPGHDEINELGATLNALLARIADARARERAFIDDASHELRAPLAVVRGELELALLDVRDGAGPDDYERALRSAVEETDRLTELTDHLLVLARADAGALHPTRERLAVRDVVLRCLERVPTEGVEVDVTGNAGWVAAGPVELDRVVTNLLLNAVRWADARVTCHIEEEGDRVRLVVSDDGPGFSDDYLAHPFERFRRGDVARGRSGGGLGLAISATLVAAQDGTARLGNGSPLGGGWVEITLPASPPTPPADRS